MVDPMHGERLGLRRLRYVATLAEEGSVRMAAAMLTLPTRVLVRELREAERAAGMRLFQRLPRGIVPTTAGRELAGIGRHALAGAVRENRAAAGDAQALRIGALEFGRGKAMKRAALAEFHSRYPHLAIEVVSTSFVRQIQGLEDGTLNVGFRAGPRPLPAGLTSAVLELQSLGSALLPAGHALATRDRVSLDDLRGDPVVRLEQSLTTPVLYDEMARRGWRGRFTSGSPSHSVVIQRIAGGAGWSPMTSEARGWLPSRLVLVPLREGPLIGFQQQVVWRESDPIARAFIQLLLEVREVFNDAGTAAPAAPAKAGRARGRGFAGGQGRPPADADALLQAVLGSELILEGVRRRLPPEMVEESRQLDLVIDGLEVAARDERRALEALHGTPAPAPRAGLASALAQAAAHLRGDVLSPFRMEVFGIPAPLQSATEEAAYRIAAEAMAHAFGDPSTSAVTLSISYHPARFAMAVSVHSAPGQGTLPPGVDAMRRYAEGAGGTLAARRGGRRGIRVTVRVPGGAAYGR